MSNNQQLDVDIARMCVKNNIYTPQKNMRNRFVMVIKPGLALTEQIALENEIPNSKNSLIFFMCLSRTYLYQKAISKN